MRVFDASVHACIFVFVFTCVLLCDFVCFVCVMVCVCVYKFLMINAVRRKIRHVVVRITDIKATKVIGDATIISTIRNLRFQNS